MGLKNLIVAHFSKQLLLSMLQSSTFEEIDIDGDEKISRDELCVAAARKLGEDMADITTLLVDNLFAICDANGDGFICRDEVLNFSAVAMQRVLFRPQSGCDVISIEEARIEIAALHPPSTFTDAKIHALLRQIDNDDSGYICRAEYETFLRANPKLSGTRVNI